MRTVSVRLADLQRCVIPIGFVDENLHTQVRIDCKAMFNEYPTAIPSLTVCPMNGVGYPAITTRDGDYVIWDVQASDVTADGKGEFQLTFTVDNVVAKSYIGKVNISRSLLPSGSAPQPIEDWITEANTVLNGIPQVIEDDVNRMVPPAVEEWLDDHPEATTTVDFSVVSKVFNTVADMVADDTLKSGDNVATKGYYAAGDNGGFNYVISASHTGTFYIELANGLYANRLTETKYIYADTIGAKHYGTEALALEDTESMVQNNTIVQTAIDNGFSVIFGKGWYAFNEAIQMKTSVDLMGMKREETGLTFPNSIGLDFDVERAEYHYQYYGKMRIKSLGNCINITADVANVINCRFDHLWLVSEEGECIVAPPNNVGWRGSIDTCVWSCYFTFIHAESKVGAMIANVKGLGNWFMQFLMLGETKWAFRNCTGTFIRLDTGCAHPEVCFYFDQVTGYDLHIFCKDVHFEACEKSFIYTESSTTSTMAIGLYAIDSGVTRPAMENSEIPFIKVGRLLYLYHFGSYTMLPPESKYNMTALNGAIIHTNGLESAYYTGFKTNLGGKEGLKIYAGTTLYTFYDENRTGVRYQDGGRSAYEVRPSYHAMEIDNIYGGRNHQNLLITEEMLPSGSAKMLDIKNIDDTKLFCDSITFKVISENILIRQLIMNEAKPGKIITIENDQTSTKNVVLEAAWGSGIYVFAVGSSITLTPGETVHFILDYKTVGNAIKLRWCKFNYEYALPDASNLVKGGVMIEDTPTQNSTKAITSGGVYTALSTLHNLNIHICTSGEYDSSTGVPTIVNPDANTFYLVPDSGGASGDIFVEWIYVSNAWEIFGSARLDLSGYVQKTDIDSVPTESSDDPVSSGGVYTALSAKQGTLTFDTAPTANSTNPVTSGGVKTAIDTLSGQVVKIDANGYFYVD